MYKNTPVNIAFNRNSVRYDISFVDLMYLINRQTSALIFNTAKHRFVKHTHFVY